MKKIWWRLVILVVITSAAFIISLNNIHNFKFNLFNSKKLNLGLDLQGGAHILMEVQHDVYIRDQLEIFGSDLRKNLRQQKIGYRDFVIKDKNIKILLVQNSNIAKIRKLISAIDRDLTVVEDNKQITIEYSKEKLHEIYQKLIDKSIEIIRARIDSDGTKEPLIQNQGEKYILLQVAGAEDPNQLKKLIGKTAKLSFHLVEDNLTINHLQNGSAIPRNYKLVTDKNNQAVVIERKPALLGNLLTFAQASFNQGQPVVSFELNNLGSKIFAKLTSKNQHRRMAIILDNQLLSSPVINEPILAGKGVISGNFTIEEATELALLLRSGSLPAPLKVVEERTVGPSLGLDSIESGKKAGFIAFISVMIFMFWTYGMFGFFANIALILTLIYTFSSLSLLEATLTLPGIAGIILTIGMAVDANVLIYENIREELKKGTTIAYSIQAGFKSAFATILDSNITTLVAAALLYIFGLGTIRGFAITLTIGIISAMFSSIWVTKLLIDIWYIVIKPKSLKL